MMEAQLGQEGSFVKESLFGFVRGVIVLMRKASTAIFVDKSTMIHKKMMHV